MSAPSRSCSPWEPEASGGTLPGRGLGVAVVWPPHLCTFLCPHWRSASSPPLPGGPRRRWGCGASKDLSQESYSPYRLTPIPSGGQRTARGRTPRTLLIRAGVYKAKKMSPFFSVNETPGEVVLYPSCETRLNHNRWALHITQRPRPGDRGAAPGTAWLRSSQLSP